MPRQTGDWEVTWHMCSCWSCLVTVPIKGRFASTKVAAVPLYPVYQIVLQDGGVVHMVIPRGRTRSRAQALAGACTSRGNVSLA
jgi:hypothetical protein